MGIITLNLIIILSSLLLTLFALHMIYSLEIATEIFFQSNLSSLFLHLKYLVWDPRFLSMASKEPMPRYFFSRMPSEKKYSPGASLVAASREPIITGTTARQSVDLHSRGLLGRSGGGSNLWRLPAPGLWRCGQRSGCRRRRWPARRTSWRTRTPCRLPSPGVGRTPALCQEGEEFRKYPCQWDVCQPSCYYLATIATAKLIITYYCCKSKHDQFWIKYISSILFHQTLYIGKHNKNTFKKKCWTAWMIYICDWIVFWNLGARTISSLYIQWMKF